MSTELINRIETGHEDMIHDAQMDFYGMRLATCSSDRTIKIYQIKNDAHYLTATLNGHLGPVWQLAWSHPKFGNLLASCSYDKTVVIWKEMGGESGGSGSEWIKSYEYRNHDASVNAIEWAPVAYGLMLVCGSSDGSISFLINDRDTGVWSSKKIPNAHSIGVMAVSWAPVQVDMFALDDDDKNGLENHRKRIVSGGCDNLIKLWIEDVAENGGGGVGNEMRSVTINWREEARLDLHTDWVRDVSWSPWLRSGTEMFASCSQDGKVVVWHRKAGEDDSWTPTILNKFAETVWNVSWSLSGDVLAVSHGQSENSLWRLDAEHKWISLDDGDGSAGVTEVPPVPQRMSTGVVNDDHQV